MSKAIATQHSLTSSKLRKYAEARGFTLTTHGGRKFSVGEEFGPANAEACRLWLEGVPTLHQRRLGAEKLADTPTRAQHARPRGYQGAIYDPEIGEVPPPGLRGLHVVTVLLPAGADGDDALRGLWRAEDHARRRGCPAVATRLEDAREAIASGVLAPVEIICSDHDLASVAAYDADIATVMLAGYFAGAALVRGRRGPRDKKIPGLWAV